MLLRAIPAIVYRRVLQVWKRGGGKPRQNTRIFLMIMSTDIQSLVKFIRRVKCGVSIRYEVISTQFDQGLVTANRIEQYRLKLMMILYNVSRIVDELRRYRNAQPVTLEMLLINLTMLARLVVVSCARFDIQCNLKKPK